MRIIFSVITVALILLAACGACHDKSTAGASAVVTMPDSVTTPDIHIVDLNYWIENDRFFVVGICDNNSNDWQRIWLRMKPFDGSGNPISINDNSDAFIRVFSDAIPPRGRSSFFAEWSLSSFSGKPDSCQVTGAGALVVNAGPILVPEEQSGVKMLYPKQQGDSTIQEERAWQVNVMVNNPLPLEASHPRVELLLYGTDKRLWFAQIINPEDPQMKGIIGQEREGPMAGGEKRRIGCNIVYTMLPERLKAIKIGHADCLPFNARPE